MMNKIIAFIAVVAVLVAGGFLLQKARNGDDLLKSVGTAVSPIPGDTSATSSSVKEFTVEGSKFSFSPKTMTVNKGDTVKINFVNSDGTHDFVIDEFGARTPIINGGQSATITFVADKSGDFEYYCSVGTHRQMGMVGVLTVN